MKFLKILMVLGGMYSTLNGMGVYYDPCKTSPQRSASTDAFGSPLGHIPLQLTETNASEIIISDNQKLFLMQLANNVTDLIFAYIINLSEMLSNPDTMKYYLTGKHYPRDRDIDSKLHLEIMPMGAGEGNLGHLSNPGLFNIVLSYLTPEAYQRYIQISKQCQDFYCELDESQREATTTRCDAAGYELPKRIAAHLELDLRNDGLPRYVLGIQEEEQCKVIGFMRFGFYPKSMIENDLKPSPMLMENFYNHNNLDGSYAIPAMMIHHQYTHRGLGKQFFRHFIKRVLPSQISQFPYPEGQLAGFYITMHRQNPVFNRLISELGTFTTPVIEDFVILGQKENDEKVVMLLKLNAVQTQQDSTLEQERV